MPNHPTVSPKIRILGPVEVEGKLVKGKVLSSVLVLLVLTHDRAVARERLREAWRSWDGTPSDNSVQQQITRLRKEYGLHIILRQTFYQLHVERDEVDVYQFVDGVSNLHAAPDSGRVDELLGLWRDDPRMHTDIADGYWGPVFQARDDLIRSLSAMPGPDRDRLRSLSHFLSIFGTDQKLDDLRSPARLKPETSTTATFAEATSPADNPLPDTLWGVVRQDAQQHEALVTAISRVAGVLEGCDGGHADRLVTILDRLLGPWLVDVTPAEAALLLLAAFHHGIGDRLAAYLHQLPPTLLNWHGTPLLNPVMALCRSAELRTVDLRGPTFDAVPGLEADLRLCAVVFRIAELFDVTDVRPPTVVRRHVGLAAFTRAVSGSIHSGGLEFPADRPRGYAISLLAAPDHPSAEHDLRDYLSVVDGELLQCQAVRFDPHPRGREITLPGRAATDRIYPIGYRYGEFRFELDRAAVLELFMGEQLYDDPHVFVRELLQNAFDAARLRRYLHGGEPGQQVAVTCWHDETGSLWVRVDDPGIGMDEHTLRDYFLRVGRSYYRSHEFAAEAVQLGKEHAGFTPISRFGIGVLACFMAADRVEVSTRRLYADGTLATPLRLSLSRDDDYFVLREEGMPAGAMPARTPTEAAAYRQKCGTSIAVRIDPLRAQVTVEDVAKTVDRYLFCPPIPVTLNGENVGRITDDLVDRPWVDGVHVVDVSVADRLPIRQGNLGTYQDSLPYWGPLRVAVIPMDLTSHSATPMLRGQLIGIRVLTDQAESDLLFGLHIDPGDPQLVEARDLLRTAVVKVEFSTRWHRAPGQFLQQLEITATRTLHPAKTDNAVELLQPGLIQRLRTEPPLLRFRETNSSGTYDTANVVTRQVLLNELANARSERDGKPRYHVRTRFMVDWAVLRDDTRSPLALPEESWLGYNGIAMPRAITERAQEHTILDGLVLQVGEETVRGVVALSDALRPDVSIARNQVRCVPFGVHSALHLAVRRAVASLRDGPFNDFAATIVREKLIEIPPAGRFTVAALADSLLDGGAWDEEPVFGDPRMVSVAEMRRQFLRGEHVKASFDPVTSWTDDYPDLDTDAKPFQFGEVIRNALLHTRLEVALHLETSDENEWDNSIESLLVVVGTDPPKRPPGTEAFPPLTFLPFLNEPTRISNGFGGWNIQHPVIAWIVDHADQLAANLPAAYDRIYAALAPNWGVYQEDRKVLTETLATIARLRPDLAPPNV